LKSVTSWNCSYHLERELPHQRTLQKTDHWWGTGI